eukprot:TRINITY_DN1565_c1_g1_i13.p2 TRINITY_DN1565_c1_g1~~TRINITY_DN1565_c1_g1_i13.p2  ORF type:complete len:224 (-),score=59.29 TRINITY_DN1565_c1_g1_i13:416-1087(-)
MSSKRCRAPGVQIETEKMKFVFLTMIVLVGLVSCAPPPTPQVPTQYKAAISLEFLHGINSSASLVGVLVLGDSKSRLDFTYNAIPVRQLSFEDAHIQYSIEKNGNNVECQRKPYNGTLHFFHKFIQYAKFIGESFIDGDTCNNWYFTLNGTIAEACITSDNVPKRFTYAVPGVEMIQIDYNTFQPGPQDPQDFVVPPQCTQEGSEEIKSEIPNFLQKIRGVFE